jgi:NAD(P)-dependent dehydrogenase (short-subunit alcohol dehydrogenase family)
MKALKGMNCLITGGTRGIGRATVFSMADAGANVAFIYHSSKAAADELCELVQAKGVRCKGYQADVSREDDAEAAVKRVIEDFGAISILVNNASITHDKSFLKMTKAMWDEVLGVNLNSLFNITHAVLPSMAQLGWGRIINLASVVGQQGNFGQANYAVTKGGTIAFTMTLAREVANKGITVNAVAPGFIETDMTKDIPPAGLEQVKALTPLGRLGKPEEVAGLVAFLMSPDAAYITRQVISVNGGLC